MDQDQKQSWDITAAKGVESFIAKTQNLPNFIKKPAGFLLTGLGVVLLILPGPGIVTLLCGLTLLSPKTAHTTQKYLKKYSDWRERRQQKKK